jgi:hypothetical protein
MNVLVVERQMQGLVGRAFASVLSVVRVEKNQTDPLPLIIFPLAISL